MTQAESISLDDKKFTKGFIMKWSILAALLIMTFTSTAYATPTETVLFLVMSVDILFSFVCGPRPFTAFMTETPQRVSDQRLPQGLTQCPKRASA